MNKLWAHISEKNFKFLTIFVGISGDLIILNWLWQRKEMFFAKYNELLEVQLKVQGLVMNESMKAELYQLFSQMLILILVAILVVHLLIYSTFYFSKPFSRNYLKLYMGSAAIGCFLSWVSSPLSMLTFLPLSVFYGICTKGLLDQKDHRFKISESESES
ncbi:hypothetical protein HBN50_00660 [Halobacteriovorax sp. GB3]|uniref:hypothetical protein n=1 Tax=Halobacteriovorax sp. GB3 TaxID=2719615 RepID=UPI002361D90D|nr:hypothetical protein [Halobacteriovorax sp. GB3]MDD0851577.1 hypothetical protein [Halobacteriovorax sp. GB3]